MALGLRQIRYFIAIADAGVLSRAAETLNVAQSALSHHVAALETDLGVKLLERRPRGIALTAAGRRLYEHASAVLSALGKAEEDVRTYNEAATGPVCIGLSHTALSMVALDVMKTVRKNSPGVHLTIVEALSPALIERVFSGTVDLALAYNPPKDARLDVELLHDEELYLVGHPSLIGRSSSPIAFSAIPQRSVVGLTPMPASRAIIQTQVLRNQITPSETLEVDSLSALRMAIEAGLGCAILSRATVLSDLAAEKYHARRIIDPPLTRSCALVSLADRPQTKAFLEVRRTMVEIVRAAVNEGRWPAKGNGRRSKRATPSAPIRGAGISRRHLTRRHSLEFLQRGIHRVPAMAADAVRDQLRIELAWVVKAGRVNRYQFRHRDECQVDRRSAGRAEGVELFVPAVARDPPVFRFTRNAHIGSPGEDQIGSMPRAASLLAIAALAVALDDGCAARLITDRAARTSAGIGLGHGHSPVPD